jgi:hypothetical protein
MRTREVYVIYQRQRLAGIACGALLALVAGAAGAALPQRTFVSTGGSDTNACSLAAPCRSFGAAIAQTADNGEIVVLDSGGYGPVIINKSIEIIAPPGVYAGITAAAGTGIQIVSPAQTVAVRGVAINGLGTGQFGIDVQSGGQITIERCRIANFTQDGLRFASAIGLSMHDSEIRDNGGNGLTIPEGIHNIERTTLRHNTNGADVSGNAVVAFIDSVAVKNTNAGMHFSDSALVTITGGSILDNAVHGVHLDGSVPSGFLRVAIDRANISNNSTVGVFANGTAASALVQVAIARSVFVENFNAVVSGASGGSASRVFVTDSVFERNAQIALSSSGTGAEVTITSNVVTGSSQGVGKFSGGVVFTRSNNTVRGNATDVVNGPFTAVGGT